VARKVLRRPRTKQDLLDQALFIADDNLDAAERFLDAAEAAFARLLELPEIGVAREYRNKRFAGLRLCSAFVSDNGNDPPAVMLSLPVIRKTTQQGD
jgi:plasmid stabilization system protein ParE